MYITRKRPRQAIIVYNNEFVKESSNARTFQEIKSPINTKDILEEEVELNVFLDGGKKINFKLNLDEDIYSKVDNFCKRNNINQEGQNTILESIDSKIAELMKQKKEEKINIKINNNNKNKNEYISYKNNIEKNLIKLKNKTLINKRKEEEICKKLYEEGEKFKLDKQRKIEIIKKKISDLSPKYDFKPKLSKKTLELTCNRNRKKIKIEDRLLTLENERKKKILQKIAEKNIYEESQINNISSDKIKYKKKNLKRNKSEDIFNKLHNDKRKMAEKAETEKKNYFEKYYPFKPEITEKAKKMTNDRHREIIQRYNNKQQQIKELNNKEKKKSNIDKSIEKKENNPKPKVFIAKNIKNVKSFYKKPIVNKTSCHVECDEEIDKKRKINIDKKVNNIMKKIKDHKFKEIFDLLDNKKQGFLNHSNLPFSKIEPRILEALSPLIGEMKKNKEKNIYFSEFKNLTYESLSKCMSEDE